MQRERSLIILLILLCTLTLTLTLPVAAEQVSDNTVTIGENGDRDFAFYTFETMKEKDGVYAWVPQLQWIKDPESGTLWRMVIDGVPSDELISGTTAPVNGYGTGKNNHPSLPAIFTRTFSL